MQIISPKFDYCMKELMAKEIILKHFISDILGIPIEHIRSIRLMNTFLWKRYKNQKLGILDILVELNDTKKINIEIQLKAISHWDLRQIFYLAKLFTADLRMGEDYTRLHKCISISILDFNLTDSPEYHSEYRLRDKQGNDFSDALEIHILELHKKLSGNESIDNWIRLFNATTEQDLDMIDTQNEGILAAIQEVRVMSLSNRLRVQYEAHLKEKRDLKAREEYVWQEGLEKGILEFILDNLEEGISHERICEKLCNRFQLSKEKAEEYMNKAYNKNIRC